MLLSAVYGDSHRECASPAGVRASYLSPVPGRPPPREAEDLGRVLSGDRAPLSEHRTQPSVPELHGRLQLGQREEHHVRFPGHRLTDGFTLRFDQEQLQEATAVDVDHARSDRRGRSSRLSARARSTHWDALPPLALSTTVPVLTEVFHMLSPDSQGADRVRDFVAVHGLAVWFMDSERLDRAFELMEQYADHPMDLADASLIVAAEALGTRRIFTVDRRDFPTYRIRRGHRGYSVEIVGCPGGAGGRPHPRGRAPPRHRLSRPGAPGAAGADPRRSPRPPGRFRHRAPTLDEHTDAILAELGYDAQAIAGLHARGVV